MPEAIADRQHLNEQVDADTIARLTNGVADFVNGVGPDVSHSEVVIALINGIGGLVTEIDCADCRKMLAKNARSYLKAVLQQALADAANIPREGESAHLH
jgi:hypothetical protein